jgi:hypothetical protein
MSDPIRAEEPMGKLTYMANRMINRLEDDEEFTEDISAIVMLTDHEMNGVCLMGWDDDVEALAFLFDNIKAIMKVNGKQMDLVFLDKEGIELI